MATSSGQFLAKRVYNESWLYAQLQRSLHQQSPIANDAALLSSIYTSAFNGVDFPDAGVVPAHRIFTNGYTRIIVIGGGRTQAQLAAFYNASFIQRRGVNEYCNEACASAAEIILGHADAFQGNPANQILSGYSMGGAVAQAFAMNFILNIPPQATFKVFMFGAPRQWQRVDRFPGPAGIVYFRWNNDGDFIPSFPPHADEASIATALFSTQIREIVAKVEHVGQGIKLYSDGSYFRTDTGTTGTAISDLYLWGWLLSNEYSQVKDHSIAEYVLRLNRGFDAAEGSATLSLEEFDPRALPIVEMAGRLMTPAQAQAIVIDAARQVKERRGVAPTQVPYYTIKRGPNWNCECEGQVVSSGGSRKNAARLARTLNAAWRSWWTTRFADTNALQNSVFDNFPS